MGIDPGQLSSALAQLGNIGQGNVTVTGVVTAAGFAASGGSTLGPTSATALVVTGPTTLDEVVIAAELPTADPAVTGRLWANSDVVTVSTP